LFAGHVAD